MQTLILPTDHAEALPRALDVLRAGGLVAFPTDTVYGLGASAFDEHAIQRIYLAKQRPPDKAIPVLLGDLEDLTRICPKVPPLASRLAQRFWPGPLTLVVPKRTGLPPSLSADETVGVRVPDHPAALRLLRTAGPLAVSSANRSGGASPSTAEEVLEQLAGRIDLLLDGGRTPGGSPSTVADCRGGEPVILRAGPLSDADLRAALGLEL